MSVDLTGLTGADNFDASKVEPFEGFDPIPAGDYVLMMVGSEMKESKQNANNKYMNWRAQVAEGPHKGRTLFEIMNLGHEKEDVRKIAQGQLSALCRAVGIMQVRNSAELYNRPFGAKVTIEKYEDKFSNKIKSYHALGSQPAQSPTTQQAPQTQVQNGQPSTGAFQPGAAAPWKK